MFSLEMRLEFALCPMAKLRISDRNLGLYFGEGPPSTFSDKKTDAIKCHWSLGNKKVFGIMKDELVEK